MRPTRSDRGTSLVEAAPAKVNLSLRVLGRRPDGYHELESLVVFAGVSDVLTMVPGLPLELRLAGAEATALRGDDNLVLRAARAALSAHPSLAIGQFQLQKTLPVAAGLGGGSADAAAALRLVARANPQLAPGFDWMAVAASVGSDVPVCLVGRPAVMSGRGERVLPLAASPPCWLVLANPRLAVSTSAVFDALAAPPLADAPPFAVTPPKITDFAGLLDYLGPRPNDLEPAAIRICPAIASVLGALASLPGAELTRMSGSGATCFALFASQAPAEAGAAALADAHPEWWVRAAPLL